MPYSEISELPKAVKNLPAEAKRLFIKAFNKAYKDYNEEQAFKIAWSVVKKAYSMTGNKWVMKENIAVKSSINREGYFWNPSYYFDIILSGNREHIDGKKVSQKLLYKLYSENLIDDDGDINHLAIDGNPEYKGLFKKIGQKFKDGYLAIRVAINKAHNKYKEFIKNNKDKYLKLSAEFYNPKVLGDLILDADGVGWTLTDNPADTSSTIINIGELK